MNSFDLYRLGKYVALSKKIAYEGLPGVLGNKGTLAKYRREQGNISQFLGTGNKISKNFSTKTFERVWEHGNIGQFWKGTREQGPPPPPWKTLAYGSLTWSTSCCQNCSVLFFHWKWYICLYLLLFTQSDFTKVFFVVHLVSKK